MSQASLAEIFYCRVSRGFDKLVRLRFLQKDYNDAAAPPSPAPGRKIGRSYSFRSHWASLRLNVSFGCQALRLMLHSAKMHVYLFQSSNQILPAGQMLRANRTQSCFPSGYFVIWLARSICHAGQIWLEHDWNFCCTRYHASGINLTLKHGLQGTNHNIRIDYGVRNTSSTASFTSCNDPQWFGRKESDEEHENLSLFTED